jgi:hypothetical protein
MKTTKYTDDDTRTLIDLYNKTTSIEKIALILDRTPKSVISKLTSLGLYHKQPYLDKQGLPPKKKLEYVQDIAAHLNVPEELVESLEKCTKYTLKCILDKFNELRPETDVDT